MRRSMCEEEGGEGGYLVASCQGYRPGAVLLLAPILVCCPQGLAQGQVYLYRGGEPTEKDGDKESERDAVRESNRGRESQNRGENKAD